MERLEPPGSLQIPWALIKDRTKSVRDSLGPVDTSLRLACKEIISRVVALHHAFDGHSPELTVPFSPLAILEPLLC